MRSTPYIMGDSFRMRHHLSQAASVEILNSKAPITHPFSDLYFSSHTPVEQQKKINYPTTTTKKKPPESSIFSSMFCEAACETINQKAEQHPFN